METDGGHLACPDVPLVLYRGTLLEFTPPLQVTPPLIDRLVELETLVSETGTAIYGRPPRRIVHAGGYVCRLVLHRSGRYSEHALGNAVDVVGFQFPAVPEGRGTGGASATVRVLPQELQTRFEVRVLRHWGSERESDRLHVRFLRSILEEVVEQDVFRTVLGPGAPRHDSHFHFDMAPWGHVNFEIHSSVSEYVEDGRSDPAVQ